MSAMVGSRDKERDYKVAQEAQNFFRGAIQCSMDGSADKLETLLGEFLSKNPGVSAQDVITDFQSEGRTLVHIASISGHSSVFDYLLGKLDASSKSVMVNRVDDKGSTPLINATIGENASIMSKLLKMGAKVNARNTDQAAAVHFAAGDGSVERTKLLVDAGANVSLASLSGGNCLHWAASKGRSEVIKYLLSLGPSAKLDVNLAFPSCPPAIIMAAVACCDAGVVSLVQAGADTGMLLTGNLTVLHICAEQNLIVGAAAIVATENGVKCCLVETTDGNLPIHLAAMHGLDAMIKLLLPHSGVGTDVAALLADGKERLKRWEEKHKDGSATGVGNGRQRGEGGEGGAHGAASGSPAESSALANRPRSTRLAESTAPAATPQDAQLAEAAKESGNEHFKAKRYSQALAEYTKAIALQGDDASFWSNRSACYLALGEAPDALLDAEICRRLRPDWTKGCYRLAAARLELGLYEDAAVAAFEGIKLDSDNLPLKTLCQLAVKKGKEEHQKKIAAEQSAAK